MDDITRKGSYRNKINEPIGRIKKTITLDYASAPAVIESDLAFNGLTKQIIFKVPDLTDSHTAELKILDEDDNELFASGEKAESTTHTLVVERALCGTVTLRIETSGNETADKEFDVTIYHL